MPRAVGEAEGGQGVLRRQGRASAVGEGDGSELGAVGHDSSLPTVGGPRAPKTAPGTTVHPMGGNRSPDADVRSPQGIVMARERAVINECAQPTLPRISAEIAVAAACSGPVARSMKSSVIRGSGPETDSANGWGVSEHRHGDAPHPDLLLPLVEGVAALTGAAQLGGERGRVGEGVLGAGGHAGPGEDRVDDLGSMSAMIALPTPVECGQHPASHLGEHPHGVAAGHHLADVDDLVAVEHGEVDRLTELVGQPLHVRPGPAADHPRRRLAEPDQPGAERVLARGLLAHVAEVDQGPDQAVDGRQRQLRVGRELRQADHATGVGHRLQDREGALERLDSAAGLRGAHGRRFAAGPVLIYLSPWASLMRRRFRIMEQSSPCAAAAARDTTTLLPRMRMSQPTTPTADIVPTVAVDAPHEVERSAEILTPEALAFLGELQTRFGARRDELLAARRARRAEVSRTGRLDFLDGDP